MENPNIMGPHDYQQFYHTSSKGLVWLDRKGNPIPLSCMLDTQVEAIDPSELWNFIQTRSKVHKQTLTALGNGPTNSTTIDANAPVLMTPTNPIMENHVEVSHSEGSSMTTVKDLLEDPQIQPGMMWLVLSTVTSLFTPSKLPSTGDNNLVVTSNVPVGSTPNVKTSDMNRECSTCKERLALGLSNFKKQLETQSCIEAECVKLNLKSEFDHELWHQTLTQTEDNKCTETTDWPVGDATPATAGGHMPIVASGSPTTRCDSTSPTTPTSSWPDNIISNWWPGWSHGHLK